VKDLIIGIKALARLFRGWAVGMVKAMEQEEPWESPDKEDPLPWAPKRKEQDMQADNLYQVIIVSKKPKLVSSKSGEGETGTTVNVSAGKDKTKVLVGPKVVAANGSDHAVLMAVLSLTDAEKELIGKEDSDDLDVVVDSFRS